MVSCCQWNGVQLLGVQLHAKGFRSTIDSDAPRPSTSMRAVRATGQTYPPGARVPGPVSFLDSPRVNHSFSVQGCFRLPCKVHGDATFRGGATVLGVRNGSLESFFGIAYARPPWVMIFVLSTTRY